MLDPAPSPLSPGDLLRGLQIASPTVPVTITAVVDGVKSGKQFAYLRLSGDGGCIDARVPLREAPPLGAAVRITGALNVGPDKLMKGLKVTVYGRVDGPVVTGAPRFAVDLNRGRRISLATLLSDPQASLDDLIVIGTERAYGDLAGMVLGAAPPFIRASSISIDKVLSAASLAIDVGAIGIIFARGGSADVTEDVWDDSVFVSKLIKLQTPFYTAIGHSDRMHLADKLADQAFATPTHIGAEIQGIADRKAAVEQDRAARSVLQAEVERLRSALARRTEDTTRAPIPGSANPVRRVHVELSPQAWILIALIVILAIAISPAFHR